MAQVLGRIGPLFPLPPVPASGPHAGSNGGMGHERTWVPYSESTMASASLRERMARVSASWCRFGAGAPAVVSLFYVSKAALYWLAFCWLAGLDPAGSPQRLSGDVGLDLHKRFIVFNMLFEALGLGCGAGPLNAKYAPPLLSFVWHNLFSPLRLPPLVGPWATARCARRTALDASLYVAFLALSLRIIVVSGLSESESQPQGAQLQPGPPEKVPWSEVAALMACFTALGARDRVFALAGRVEVYGYLLAACLLARSDAEAVAGMQVVQVAIWVFAGTSKLGPWFAFVLPIMLSNCPLLSPLGKLRSWALWRHVPDDLRPSRLMHAMAHFGTAAEFAFPLALCAGGHLGLLGVVGCMGFHAFIIAQVPMGAPVEWNLFSMHNALFLFTSTQGAFDVRALCGTLFGDGDSRDTAAQGLGARLAALASSVHAPGLQLAALQAPPLQLFLLLACVALPIYGQLRPDKVSFLLAFRYYAGNWPFAVYFVKRSALSKLDRMTDICASPWTHRQLAGLFDADALAHFEFRALCGRALHLGGRAVPAALRAGALGDVVTAKEYYSIEGELVAGIVLGFNFGDGFLAGLPTARAVAEHCGLEEHDLLLLECEAIPLFGKELRWTCTDAVTGNVVAAAAESVRDLVASQPYPAK